jgi:acyl-CoA thioesterase-2
MRDVLGELISLLSLERLEQNLFRGQSQDLGWGQIFGGQVLGQALSAASQTVPEGRRVHSLHGYFLRGGDAARPVIYEVDPIRDGRSFTTRRVVAIQGGRAIFNMAASFQIDEAGFTHQTPMPSTAGPDGIPSELDLARKVADRIPEKLRARATADRPIEIRPLDPHNPFRPKPQSPRQQLWYRASGALPDAPALHPFLLAYASDFQFLVTALRPHGVSWLSREMQVTSLDHAMYFHRPFRMDDWLLYDIESPWAGGARALVRGRFYDRDGNLVASTMQEGLIRDWRNRDSGEDA